MKKLTQITKEIRTQLNINAQSTWTEVFRALFESGELTSAKVPYVIRQMERNPFAKTNKGIQDAIEYLESIKEPQTQ